MKTQFNFFLITCFASLALINNSRGQSAGNHSSKISSFTYGDILANAAKDGSLVEARVSQPALIAFSKSYPNVTKAKWYRVEKNYLVSFIRNGNQARALFNVKGKFIYSICYGSEKDMPKEIRKYVKKEYTEYDILRATEVNEDKRNIWVINLGDDKTLITARAEDGFIEEINRYSKF